MPAACVLIPVKRFALAKSRFAASLGPQQRRWLAATMLRQVLESVAPRASSVPITWSAAVVTDEPEAIELANSLGIAILAEPRARTLEAALQSGIETLARLGFVRLAYLPGDVPQLTTDDVRELLGDEHARGVRLVAAKRDGALNAISWPTQYALPLEFGPGSAARLTERIAGEGIDVERLTLPQLELDIDVEPDLTEWLARAPAGLARGMT